MQLTKQNPAVHGGSIKTTELKQLLAARTPGDWTLPHFAYSDAEWAKVFIGLPKIKNSHLRCDCGYILCETRMGSVAEVNYAKGKNESDHPPRSEAIANAKLLAAAPQLAAELLRLRDRVAALKKR